MKWLLVIIVTLFSICAAKTDYYVATSGSDANTCLLVSAPCKTWQHVVDVCPGGVQQCAVHVADGAYNENPSITYYKIVVFTGNCGALTNVVINGTIQGQDHSITGIQCLKFTGAKTRQFAIMDMYFTTSGGNPGGVDISADEKSKINVFNDYVAGDAAYHYAATGQSTIAVGGALTLIGLRTFSALAYSVQQSLIDASGLSTSGSNAGSKCIIGDSSIIANGGVFPGSGTC